MPTGRLPVAALLAALALAAVTRPAMAQDGPWNHRVLLATSADGLKWVVQPETLAG
jgi:hypothetical protein